MSLLHLPTEILHQVLAGAPRTTLAQLCLTCRLAYERCLPFLYTHVELCYRAHIQQFDNGLQRRLHLRHTVAHCTRELTLSCRQSGNHWLVANLWPLFSCLKSVRTLTLTDFRALSVDKVRQLARILPEIRHMNFRYCTLTMDKAGPSEDTDDDNLCFTKVTHLSLFWTDFSDKSISELLRGLPHLQTVDLGANHNKVPRANDTALEALRANCPLVTHLSVALQQVKEQTLCEAIMQYGHQLKSLSIRCDSVQSLRTVAAHATHVEKLKVSAAGVGTLPVRSEVTQQTPREREHRVHLQAEEAQNDQEDEGAVIGVLRQCHRLVRLEMVCWMIQDVPGIVWRAIETVAQRREQPKEAEAWSFQYPGKANGTPVVFEASRENGRPAPTRRRRRSPEEQIMAGIRPGDLKKTLALDVEELQEIRNQFTGCPFP